MAYIERHEERQKTMNKKSEMLSDEFKQSTMSLEKSEEDSASYEKMHGFSSEKLLEMQAEATLPA
jgi:hypothetical protein